MVFQLASLKLEMSGLHSTLEEERELASQHQLALQAQISEAHARSKVRNTQKHTHTHMCEHTCTEPFAHKEVSAFMCV